MGVGGIHRDQQSLRKARSSLAVEMFLITLWDPALNHPLMPIRQSAWPTQSLQYAGSHKTVNFLKLVGGISLFLYQNVSPSSLEGLISLLKF